MSRSIRVAPEYIQRVKVALRRHGFPSQKSLAQELGISRATTDKFFTGKPVDYSYFVEISERLGLDWHAIAYIEEEPSIQVEPLPPTHTPPTAKDLGINWRQVCQDMLSAQNQRRLTTNPLTAGDGVAFELDEIYVPLGLVERKQRHRVGSDVAPEQGSQLYVGADLVSAQDEIVQTFQQDEFFEQVLRPGRSRRIAIIGEPGAGKTTLLQKIASWVLDNTSDVPIWISLADLQGKSLEQYLLEDWLKAATRKVRVTEAMQDALGELFNSKRVWLLLDAVDEMSIGAYGNAPLQWIANQITGWVADARVVLTCRLNVWDAGKNALEAFETYRNLDFSYGEAQTPDQVGQFIKRWFNAKPARGNRLGQFIWSWFNANPVDLLHKSEKPLPSPPRNGEGARFLPPDSGGLRGVNLTFARGLVLGDRLRTELNQPGRERIKDAVKNPLRLALLCRTWAVGQGELPNTKAGLYQQFTEALYEWKQDRFPTSSTQRQELNQALGELAKRAISEEKTKFRLRHRFVCSVLGEPDEKLFQLALQLGWLNQVGVAAEADNRGEKVYAFFHPTFQEYLAAQAIEDWHFFLNHTPNNPALGTYRIFERQWKEVILLWLGREDVPPEQKEAFIWALVTFEDGCGDANCYGLRAYLLAIAGIVELENPDGTFEILEQVHRRSSSMWRNQVVNDIKQKQQKWHTFFAILERTAQGALQETEYSRAIKILIDMLRESQDSRTHHQCLVALGKISVGNQSAIKAVIELVQTSQDYWTLYQCLETLTKIGIGSQDACSALYQLLKRIEGIRHYKSSICSEDLGRLTSPVHRALHVISNGNLLWSLGIFDEANVETTQSPAKRQNSQDKNFYSQTVAIQEANDSSCSEIIKTLLKQLYSDRDAQSWLANRLGEVSSISKQDAIKALSELLSNTPNSRTRWKVADSLGQIDSGNLDALNALISLVHNNDHRSEVVWSLKNTLKDNLFALAVSGLKDSLEDGDERCYEIIWHCAQNMSYPDFYKAWHKQPILTQSTLNLNLADLPQILSDTIANEPALSQTIHLICIDGTKFIDRNNPAAKIYAQMIKAGCPKCEDGTPKTMPELQTYWDLLDTDQRVVLVFYEDTSPSPPMNQGGTKTKEGVGFSETFLGALSKFDGAICVITAQPLDNVALKCISTECAIADVVKWLKKVVLET